jgi:hypothetical protein
MSIVLASSLSESDLCLLGNNMRPRSRTKRRPPAEQANRRVIAAVNRSLAALRERVSGLHAPRQTAPVLRRRSTRVTALAS